MLTPEIQAIVVEIISKGESFAAAGAAAGVSEDTLHRWRREGQAKRRGRLREFADAVSEARAMGCAKAARIFWKSMIEPSEMIDIQYDKEGNEIGRTVKVRPPDAAGALKFLERFGVEEWNKVHRAALGGDPNGVPFRVESGGPALALEHLLSRATNSELDALARFREELEGRASAPEGIEPALLYVRPGGLIDGKEAA